MKEHPRSPEKQVFPVPYLRNQGDIFNLLCQSWLVYKIRTFLQLALPYISPNETMD